MLSDVGPILGFRFGFCPGPDQWSGSRFVGPQCFAEWVLNQSEPWTECELHHLIHTVNHTLKFIRCNVNTLTLPRINPWTFVDVQHECGVGNSKHNLKVTRKTAPFLEVVVQASMGHIIWRGCLFRSCLYRPHTVKSALKCSEVGEERKEGCAKPGNSPHGHSCSTMHVLQTCRWGQIVSLKVFLNLLRPQTCGALSGVRRLRAALCSMLVLSISQPHIWEWLSMFELRHIRQVGTSRGALRAHQMKTWCIMCTYISCSK